MIYLHILGSGKTKSEMANSKGHLFECLTRALFEHLKMSVTHLDKSENGKEIDIEGITIVGKVKFFAKCKAQISKLLAVFCVAKAHIPEKLAARAGEPRCTWRIYVSGSHSTSVSMDSRSKKVGEVSVPGNGRGTNL